MYCMNCGKASDDTLAVCPHCGYDLTVSGTSAAPSSTAIEAFRRRTGSRPSGATEPPPSHDAGPQPTIQDFVWNDERSAAPESGSGFRRGSDKPKTVKADQDSGKRSAKSTGSNDHHKEKKPSGKKKTHKSRKGGKHHKRRDQGGILGIVKLCIGIVSISLCLVLLYQAWVSGSVDAAAENPQGLLSSAHLVLAGGLLASGALGIGTRRSRLGGMATGVLYLATAGYGFVNMGLGGIVWPVMALAFAVLFFLTSVGPSARSERREEKKPVLGKALLLLIILVVLALAATAAFLIYRGRDDGDKLTGLTYGDTFVFDDLEITIGRAVEWDYLEDEYGNETPDAFRLLLTVKNLSDQPHTLRSSHYTQIGPSGATLEKIFTEYDQPLDELSPDEEQDTYLYFLYSGDGDYTIEFETSTESAQVVLPVTGPEGEGEPEPDPDPVSEPESQVEPSSSAPASSAPESSSADSSSEASQPASSSTASEVDPEPEVTITVPALFVDDEITRTLTQVDDATGVKSVQREAGGDTTVVLTQSGHAALKAAAEQDAKGYITRMSRNYDSIDEVVVNLAMTEATITVYRDEFEGSRDGLSLDGLYFAVGYWHVLDGKTEIPFTVWLEEESTGMVYQVLDYPDDLYWYR